MSEPSELKSQRNTAGSKIAGQVTEMVEQMLYTPPTTSQESGRSTTIQYNQSEFVVTHTIKIERKK